MNALEFLSLNDVDSHLAPNITRILQQTENPLPAGVVTVGLIVSFLSLIGSIFTILTFFILGNALKNKFFFLVFNIAVADFITSIGGLFESGSTITYTDCLLTALFRDFGVICSYFFTVCIGYVIYYSARRKLDEPGVQRKITITMFLAYFFGIVGITFPVFTDSYCRPGGYECWVDPGFSWDLVVFLSEFMLPSLFVFGMTIYLFFKTSKAIEEENKYALVPNKSYKMLFWIPFIFLVCNLPGTLFSIFCFNSQSLDFLRYMNSIMRDAQGIFHTLLYSIGIINELLKEYFAKAIQNRRRKTTASPEFGVCLMEDKKGVIIY